MSTRLISSVTAFPRARISAVQQPRAARHLCLSFSRSWPDPDVVSGGFVTPYAIVPAASNQFRITTSSLPSGTVGQPYSFQLQATGGTPPYAWNKYPPKGQGVLPIWLHLSKSGLISGTPRRVGTYPIIVKCMEATPHPQYVTQVTEELTLTIGS